MVEQVEVRPDVTVPQQYLGNGQYQNLDFDNFAGVAYFRKTGKVSMDKNTGNDRKCVQFYDVSFPIRLVGCARKTLLGKDDSFSGDTICLSVFQDIVQSNGDLGIALKANESSVTITEYTDNIREIIDEEFKGLDRKNIIPLEYCLVMIDLRIDATITADCVQYYCNSYCDYSVRTGSSSDAACYPVSKNPVTLTAVTGQNDYQDNRFKNQRINLIHINNTRLLNSQFSFNSTTGTFTYIDSNVPLVTGDEIHFTFA